MENKRVIYTTAEKEVLKNLVLKYIDVVESKKTDGGSIKLKNQAWWEIENEFNANENHNKRTVKQLRKLWDNLKSERKKQLATAEMGRFLTSEGSSKKDLLDDPTDVLLLGTFTEDIDSDSVGFSNMNGHAEDSKVALQPYLTDESCESQVLEEDKTPTKGSYHEKEKIVPSTTRLKKRNRVNRISVERLKRANPQNMLRALKEEELRNKVKLSKLEVEAKEQEMRQSAEIHQLVMEANRAEMAHKLEMWCLEINALNKKLNK